MAKTGKPKRSWKKIVACAIGALVVLFAIMQVLPYGRAHANPTATNAFNWTDPQAEAIAKKACYDCHSNQTDWWWATNIAPFSWLVQTDVNNGRAVFNFSAFNGWPSAAAFERAVQGNMPPLQYTLVHPNAKLSDAEKQTLIDGYASALAANGDSSATSPGNQSVAADGTGGPAAPDSTSSTAPDSTTSTAGSSTSSTAGGSTGSAAVTIINQACASCHSPRPALNFHAASAADAKAMVDDMINRGASLTPDQEQQLIQYYTR